MGGLMRGDHIGYDADRDGAADLRDRYEDDYRSDVAREVREDPEAGLRSTIEDRTAEAVRYICGRLAAAEDPTHPQHQRAREELAGKRETPAWVREGGWGS
jgi:hypothetical protein